MAGIDTFQFHKGAIRTEYVPSGWTDDPIFQFHKGAIRTAALSDALYKQADFNSIKVRLEQTHQPLKRFTKQISIP